jgi:hypothetical protein
MNIKVKEFTEVEDEVSPVPITFPIIKAEHEVSCVLCVLLFTCHKYPVLSVVFLISTVVNGI